MTEPSLPDPPAVHFPPIIASRRAALVKAHYEHHRQRETHQIQAERCIDLIAEIDATVVACAEQTPTEPGVHDVQSGGWVAIAGPAKRPRRDVRGMVLNFISARKLGATAFDVAQALGITLRQVEAALAHYKKIHTLEQSKGGIWVVGPASVAPTNNGGPASDAPDGDATSDGPSLLDVIRAAGEQGMTDNDLAKQGFPYVAVVKAHRDGHVRLDGRRVYLSDSHA